MAIKLQGPHLLLPADWAVSGPSCRTPEASLWRHSSKPGNSGSPKTVNLTVEEMIPNKQQVGGRKKNSITKRTNNNKRVQKEILTFSNQATVQQIQKIEMDSQHFTALYLWYTFGFRHFNEFHIYCILASKNAPPQESCSSWMQLRWRTQSYHQQRHE